MSARILVIEDNPTNVDLMVYLLQAAGHTAIVARDGEEGLEAARRERPDLVLCDVQMPKLNGYEVARALKADERFRHIPLVAVTAFAMVGDREKAIDAGFDGYGSKPIEPMTFAREMDAFLATGTPAVAPAPWESAPPIRAELRGKRILALDNNRTNLDLEETTLRYLGFQVDATTDPEVAFSIALATRPDLILSDVCMPGGSGLDFLQRIKNEPDLRAIPFVFVSATATDERTRQQALAMGADDYLFRPIEIQELLAVVDKHLRGSSGET
jgi:two-component system, cell cycle response regulator